MKVALEARDKFDFVNGEIEVPDVDSARAGFRFVGYPEWWENTKNGEMNKSRGGAVNYFEYQGEDNYDTLFDQVENVVNFAGFEESAVVHLCGDINLFHSITNERSATFVKLPDNTMRRATFIGVIELKTGIILLDCLYVSSFNYNLLSVSKIGKTANIHAIFFPDFCLLQDTRNHKILAVEKEKGGLYVLSNKSFQSSIIDFHANLYSRLCNVAKPVVNSVNKTTNDVTLSYFRLGHCSPY
ncbi:hypothetical protein LIER_02933 [Lithospermum erythrorhizon]|uniref:Retrovirus-related Pol polyprotein from transposon TNT 1-94-like beta-barrel domain-containing protein n=1 Tax=Lithospermum erythrorhizon TaxID=34254 RepID=A0AAV3NRA6_LITER